MRVEVIGTRGVPPRYGGFEVAVSELAPRLAESGLEVVVYCRNRGQRLKRWRGVFTRNIWCVRNKSLETITHSALSTLRSWFGPKRVTLLFGVGSAMLIPLLRVKGPVVLHLGGLDWDRAKWPRLLRKALRWSEDFGVRAADCVVVDSLALKEVVDDIHGIDSCFISYGLPSQQGRPGVISDLGLLPGGYLLLVSRFEPENHVIELITGYLTADTEKPLVVVGAAPYNPEYTARINQLAERNEAVKLVGRVDDEAVLHSLYLGAFAYLHGHSVGGTNPSLLRALAAQTPIICWDNRFNRETVANHAQFVSSIDEVALAIGQVELDGEQAHAQASRAHLAALERFDWRATTGKYLELIEVLTQTEGLKNTDANPNGGADYLLDLPPGWARSFSGATSRASAMAQTRSSAGE